MGKSGVIIVLGLSILIYLFFLLFPNTTVYLPKQLSEQLYGERCTQEWMIKNVTKLQQSFKDHVFGQHIATKLILSTLSQRWSPNFKSKKPLVMSFHGWTGSGKNYATKFIAESLYEKGLSSRFVHLYVSTLHFPDAAESMKYKRELQDWVRGNVSQCGESVFIFDEIDKMPIGVIDGLKSYMDFHELVDGIDFRRATFILLSNTGGKEITKSVYKFWSQGTPRSNIAYIDLENLVSKGAFNENGGLQGSDLIDRSLIDLYVPFLPLERIHVDQCVERELLQRGKDPAKYGQLVKKITDQISFWPESVGLFAMAGCKRVSQKVDEMIFQQEEML